MKIYILKLLDRKFIFKMLVLITLQQIMFAGAVAALSLAGQSISKGPIFLILLSGYCALSVLPHGLSLLIKKTEVKGYWEGYFNFLRSRLLSQQGQTSAWQNQQKKEIFLTAIGPEAENYLAAVAFSIFDIYMFVIAIMLNIVCFSVVLDRSFLIAYVVAGLLSGCSFRYFHKNILRNVQTEQSAKTELFSYLLKAWDNILLKNQSIHSIYVNQLTAKHNSVLSATKRAAVTSEGVVFLLNLLSALPVLGLSVYLVMTHLHNSNYLAGLLVVLPAQLSILGNFRCVFQQVTNMSSFVARFENSWNNSRLTLSDMESRIKVGEVRLGASPLNSLSEIVKEVEKTRQGRILVTGNNGAGKSTLLLHLNSQLKKSFYLPAGPNLEIGKGTGLESTGERILKHFDFIAEQNISVLLLDEWDANLDSLNRKLICQKIQTLSEKICVVEVRHHAN